MRAGSTAAAVCAAFTPVFMLCGCGAESGDGTAIIEYVSVRSPDGRVVASVYETSRESGGLTQVVLDFRETGCGSGSLAAYKTGLNLELEWIANDLLHVYHPPGVELKDAIDGGNEQCFDRKVRVVGIAKE